MKIEDLSNENIEQINGLMRQLSPKANRITREYLQEVLAQNNFYILKVKINGPDDKIVGIATMYFEKTLCGYLAYIHDVVVDKNCQNQDVGKRMVNELLDLAKKKKAKFVEFISNPSREAANNPYKKLGFKTRETNIYRFDLEETR